MDGRRPEFPDRLRWAYGRQRLALDQRVIGVQAVAEDVCRKPVDSPARRSQVGESTWKVTAPRADPRPLGECERQREAIVGAAGARDDAVLASVRGMRRTT